MARKKDSSQKAALREMMGSFMKENNVKIKDGTDVNSIMRDMMTMHDLKDFVRSSVEETLNVLLDKEADELELVNAQRYERSDTRQSYRSGHYKCNFQTTAGEVELNVPQTQRRSYTCRQLLNTIATICRKTIP